MDYEEYDAHYRYIRDVFAKHTDEDVDIDSDKSNGWITAYSDESTVMVTIYTDAVNDTFYLYDDFFMDRGSEIDEVVSTDDIDKIVEELRILLRKEF